MCIACLFVRNIRGRIMELKILSKTYGELIVLIDSEDFYRIGNKKIYVSKSSSGFYAMVSSFCKKHRLRKVLGNIQII